MKKIGFLVVLGLLFIGTFKVFSQEIDNKPVAKIGYLTISQDEFQERYEMTPVFRKHIKRMRESLKLEFLYSLIAEKLWALEAENRHLDTTSVVSFAAKEFEKMFVRDALYKKEIRDKVTVSDSEIIQGYTRNNTKLEVNYLVSDSESVIRDLYNLLQQGIPFDTILALRPEKDEQVNPIDVVYGQMQLNIEDSLYNLKIGEYTAPFFTPDGWYIFRLKDKTEKVLNTVYDRDNSRNATKKIIEARKERQLFEKYYSDFFKGRNVDVNANLFRSLASKLSDILTKRKKDYDVVEKDPVYLEPKDLINLEAQFGKDTLDIEYIKFKKDPMSFDEFLKTLAFNGFSSVKTDYRSIVHVLNIKTSTTLEQELLSRKGYEEGLNSLPSVISDLEMWKENYLYQYLQNQFIDSTTVSDSAAYTEYLKNNKTADYPEEVNIVEVLTNSLDTVETVLNQIKTGVDMHKLAMKYTQRTWTKAKNGEFGFFPIIAYGDIGRIAAAMKIGEIYGPLKVPEGYSIFQLLDKRAPYKTEPQPFTKLKDTIERSMEYKKARGSIINYTVHLAKKYGVKIFPKTLSSVEVTDINSMGFRFLGFGGRITAVPLLAPNVDWVEKYINQNKLAQ